MSENRVDGPARVVKEHAGKRRRLDREISLREPGKWTERLTGDNRVQGPANRVESPAWNARHPGGNNNSAGEDGPPEDSEAAASEAEAFQWKVTRVRAGKRRDAARKGAPPEHTTLPVLSPVPAIRFINKDGGEVFGRPEGDKPLQDVLQALFDRRVTDS